MQAEKQGRYLPLFIVTQGNLRTYSNLSSTIQGSVKSTKVVLILPQPRHWEQIGQVPSQSSHPNTFPEQPHT